MLVKEATGSTDEGFLTWLALNINWLYCAKEWNTTEISVVYFKICNFTHTRPMPYLCVVCFVMAYLLWFDYKSVNAYLVCNINIYELVVMVHFTMMILWNVMTKTIRALSSAVYLRIWSWPNNVMHDSTIFTLYARTGSWLAPSQWETPLESNGISHWLGTNLESALYVT